MEGQTYENVQTTNGNEEANLFWAIRHQGFIADFTVMVFLLVVSSWRQQLVREYKDNPRCNMEEAQVPFLTFQVL